LKIVQLNCRSLYNKLSEIKVYIYANKPHIVCFSETWLVGDKLPNFINYTCKWKNRGNGRGGGLGILVRADIPIIPCSITEYVDDVEVQRVCIGTSRYHLDILNIYNPNRATNAAVFLKYIEQMGEHAVVLGDFIAHNDLWSVAGTPTNVAGNSLAQLLQTRDNLCLATPPGMVTYLDSRTGRKSVLDLCFVTPDLVPAAQLRVGPCLGSDHFPVEI
jgi:exonuclease III